MAATVLLADEVAKDVLTCGVEHFNSPKSKEEFIMVCNAAESKFEIDLSSTEWEEPVLLENGTWVQAGTWGRRKRCWRACGPGALDWLNTQFGVEI